jgi:type I restriction enzyme M protein
MALSSLVKSIQDIMRQDAGVDGDAQRISQLTWMLFLKIFDAKEEEYELLDRRYRSPLPEGLRWRDWAADPAGITGEELLGFVNGRLFPELKELDFSDEDDPRGFVVRAVFEDAVNFMKSGQLLRQVLNKIEGIDFQSQKERHLFNDIYETILRDLQSAGNAGEYYTPRAVTRFMTDMVAPQLGELVMDPACGTGGFLVCAIEALRAQAKSAKDQRVLQASIRGIEKKPMPHLLCVTNMLLHGVEVPSLIKHDNTLARPLRDWGKKERVDVILTNPPFGGIEEPGIEANFPASFQTKETADLFLVLIMQLLKDGGRAAVVLPDGFLFGDGIKARIKEKLLAECNLHTIVRLPNGVFAPYTGIKTNLLFFTKGGPTKDIWYYEHPYPAGYKSYSKTKPIAIAEFDREKAWWGVLEDDFASRVESELAWKVRAEDIVASGYNLDRKNPNKIEEAAGDPDELLAAYRKAETEAAAAREELKALLGKALIDGGCKTKLK